MMLFSFNFLGLIIWINLLALLLVSYFDQRKTMDAKIWLIIIGIYLLCGISGNLFGLLIPVGFVIGLIYVNKTKKLYLSKTLIFGLISSLVMFYAPKISFNQIKELSEVNKYSLTGIYLIFLQGNRLMLFFRPLLMHYYWQSNRPDPLVSLEYAVFSDVDTWVYF